MIRNKPISWLAILVCCQLFFASCNEEGSLGADILPGERPGVSRSDTFTVLCTTVLEDSLITGYNSSFSSYPSAYVAGLIQDAVFGKTQAGCAFQTRLSTEDVDFGPNVLLDSIVLSLAYSNFYGDSLDELTVRVYELDESLSQDSTYYNTKVPAKKVGFLAEQKVLPLPKTEIKYYDPEVDDSTHAGYLPLRKSQLRIRLADALGQKFLDASGSQDLKDNTNFLEFFKGLIVEVESTTGRGSLMSFDLLSSFSNLDLFYTEQDTVNTARRFSFSINGSCERLNFFENDFSGSQVESKLDQESVLDGRYFLQGLVGTRIKIRFPSLYDFNQAGNWAVNKAELVIKALETTDAYPASASILMVGIAEDGSNEVLRFQFEQNGALDSDSQTYRLLITDPIMEALQNKSHEGFYLIPSSAAVLGSRTVLAGAPHATDAMKLELTLTKVP